MDPVTADPNTGGNFNRYWYANNNPYRFTDPDGRRSKEEHDNKQEQSEERRRAEEARRQEIADAKRARTRDASDRFSGVGTAAATAARPIAGGSSGNLLQGIKLSGLGWATIWATVLSIPGDTNRRPSIVIGEGMTRRVIPYATAINAEYYMPGVMSEDQYFGANRVWINQKMDQNYRIIDIGAEPGRRNYPLPTSRYYQMELNEIELRGYPKYNVSAP